MKELLSTFLFFTIVATANAFAPAPNSNVAVVAKQSSLNMGFFDMFNSEEREKKAAAKEREVKEQMRLQQEIMERRNNPEKMEEYEARVRVRRKLRMAGKDEAAEIVNDQIYDGTE
mmetsp:Transcript_6490/g.7064  ORF Transcript_6490/g.7064 Transcript_6490/m.7064 type:complete len:116 (+) Transcript_6490:86-433(+)